MSRYISKPPASSAFLQFLGPCEPGNRAGGGIATVKAQCTEGTPCKDIAAVILGIWCMRGVHGLKRAVVQEVVDGVERA